MKKLIALALALVLALALCACGGAPAATAAPETDKLVVGFDADFPPFGFVADDGSYDGFDLALAKEVCTRDRKSVV